MSEREAVDCRAVVERVYDYLDGELDPGWMGAVRAHLERCGHCYPYFRFERAFLDHIRRQDLSAGDTERLERRVRRALFGEDVASG